MKNLHIVFAFALMVHGSIFSQTTWKSPSFKQEPLRSVMILARIQDKEARKQLEDMTVTFLADKGIQAVPAYKTLKPIKFPSRDAFLAYCDSIGVDAMLVYTVDDAEQVVKNSPTVSVGVGVGGMYGGYAGASVPIAGGAKVVAQVFMSGNFYTRSNEGSQWIIKLSGTLDGPTDKLAYTFAKSTAKAMLKDGLFISKK